MKKLPAAYIYSVCQEFSTLSVPYVQESFILPCLGLLEVHIVISFCEVHCVIDLHSTVGLPNFIFSVLIPTRIYIIL